MKILGAIICCNKKVTTTKVDYVAGQLLQGSWFNETGRVKQVKR
jgi:hypothetical protein